MKISDAPRPAAVTRRSPGGSRANGFAASVGHADGTGRAAPAPPLTAPIAILSLQEIDQDEPGQRRSVERAHDMLDELERLRLAMVEGWVPETALRRLAVLADDRAAERGGDAPLDGILQDVEVRAAVEVAKRRAADQSDDDAS